MSFSFAPASETPNSSTFGSFGAMHHTNNSLFGNASSTNGNSTCGIFGSSTSVQIPCQPGPLRGEASTKLTVEPFVELSSSLMRLFTTGAYSDLTIRCGDGRYKVHKAIICPRSSFFEAACNNAFKEAASGEIYLPDDDPLAVKMMVNYFYHLDYSIAPPTVPVAEEQTPTSPSWSTSPMSRQMSSTAPPVQTFGATNTGGSVGGSIKKKSRRKVRSFAPATGAKLPSDLSLHAKVYALAEKYDIKGLKALAVKKFEDEVEDHWESDDFLVAIQEVYTSTMDHDRSMRDVVVATFSKHSCLLDKDSVQDVVRGLDLAFDLLMYFRKRPSLR